MDSIVASFSPRKTPAKAVGQLFDAALSTLKMRKTPSSARRSSFARRFLVEDDTASKPDDDDDDEGANSAQGSPVQPETNTPSPPKHATPSKTPADNEKAVSQPSSFNYDEMDIRMEDGGNEEQHDEEDVEDDGEEEYVFKDFLNHRWVDNAIEIEVEWEQGGTTWEPESNLHKDAPDTLFAYWREQGGRPTNPTNPDMFEVFAIRKHNKNRNRLLVEWVGFEPSETSWVPRRVIEETAGDIVAAYWESLKAKKGQRRR